MNHFDERADTWDDRPGATARAQAVADAIAAQLPLGEIHSMLEYGAGTGLLSRRLAAGLPSDAAVTLADTSAKMREVARARVAELGLPWQVSDLDLTAPSPDQPEAAFDLITSLMVLHHVADVPALLRAFARALRPGGRLVVADLVSEDGGFHTQPAPGEPPLHCHNGFDPDELAAQLAAAGFASPVFTTPFVEQREVAGEPREFPLFLAVTEVR